MAKCVRNSSYQHFQNASVLRFLFSFFLLIEDRADINFVPPVKVCGF